MCDAIALAWSEVPTETIGRYGLRCRVHERGGEREIRFRFRDRVPRIPVLRDGRLSIARWGNGRRQSEHLPRGGWVWRSSIEAGEWAGSDAVRVDIPATLACEGGVWFRVRRGIRGILVPDERGLAVAYMLVEPADHYYRVMTRSHRMPCLIDQRI